MFVLFFWDIYHLTLLILCFCHIPTILFYALIFYRLLIKIYQVFLELSKYFQLIVLAVECEHDRI